MSGFAPVPAPACEEALDPDGRGTCPVTPESTPPTGLGPGVDDLVRKSPTLRASVAALVDLGWSFMYGELAPLPGGYTDEPNKLIVLDASRREDPVMALQTLSHEVGHALYQMPPEIPMDGLGREDFIEQNFRRDQMNEGEAILTQLEIRQEILDATGGAMLDTGVDIGISGGADALYLDAFENAPFDDRDALRLELGQIQSANEVTGTTLQPYEDFYSEQYATKWDDAHDWWPFW